jgi:hypothetical protein
LLAFNFFAFQEFRSTIPLYNLDMNDLKTAKEEEQVTGMSAFPSMIHLMNNFVLNVHVSVNPAANVIATAGYAQHYTYK